MIAVFDREGDIYEAMVAIGELGHSFVIRAMRNRLVDDNDPDERHYSLDEVANAPVVGYRPVDVLRACLRPGIRARNWGVEFNVLHRIRGRVDHRVGDVERMRRSSCPRGKGHVVPAVARWRLRGPFAAR